MKFVFGCFIIYQDLNLLMQIVKVYLTSNDWEAITHYIYLKIVEFFKHH